MIEIDGEFFHDCYEELNRLIQIDKAFACAQIIINASIASTKNPIMAYFINEQANIRIHAILMQPNICKHRQGGIVVNIPTGDVII